MQAAPQRAFTEHRAVDLEIALQSLQGGSAMPYNEALRVVREAVGELLVRREQVQGYATENAQLSGALQSLKKLRVPMPAAEAILRVTQTLVPLGEIEKAERYALMQANQLAEVAKSHPDLGVRVRAYEAARCELEAAERGER